MTRTTIITANGARLREEGAMRRTIRRGLMIALCAGALIFISAAIIGLIKGATMNSAPRTQDNTASFNDGWDTGLSDLMDIAKAPGGMQKVNSCITNSNDAAAFHACINR